MPEDKPIGQIGQGQRELPLRKKVFTAAEKRDELARELKYRLWVFPRQVTAKKLSQKLADRRIAMTEEMIEDYTEQAAREAAEGPC